MIRMWTLAVTVAIALMVRAAAAQGDAHHTTLDRLPRQVLDVVPPSANVRGEPGRMAIEPPACRALATEDTRRRIMDVAIQEWGFFGFRVVDPGELAAARALAAAADADTSSPDAERHRRLSRLPPAEAARVAASIAGYWTVTPEGSWIVARQNDDWKGPDGTAVRWNAPWSAAFVSWVMCEGGLGTPAQFQRAIAHHAYIDQAIRARDGRAPQAAFAAYDIGETAIAPGDLLCSSRRPAYRTIADRRRQAGVGARSHCDVVVKVDEAGGRILAVGGNVRGAVSLKILRVDRKAGGSWRLLDLDEERPIFAHLKLRAAPIEANALDHSPTIRALRCVDRTPFVTVLAALPVALSAGVARC